MLSVKANGNVTKWLERREPERKKKCASIDQCLVPSINVDKCLK